MSEKPISVGDLVVVVRGCCERRIGMVFKVAEIFDVRGRLCMLCATRAYGMGACSGPDHGGLLPWLKRIPPLEELEGEKNKEELTA